MTLKGTFLTGILLVAATAGGQPRGLLEQLVGEYNNNEQVWQQSQDGDTPVARVHWRFQALGEQRIGVSRSAGQSASAAPTWQFEFDGDLAVLASAEARALACSYRWHAQSSGFTGVADDRADCPKGFPATWRLTKDYLLATDTAGVTHRARRVTRYGGWIAFQRRHIDPSAPEDDFILLRDIDAHDEGFVVSITDDGKPTGFAVELVRLTYQNTRTAVLKLGIVDETAGETVSYSWAEPGAERIGINLRWVQAGMTRMP